MKKFLLLFVTFLAVTECLLIPKIGPSERTRQYLRQRVNNRGRILGGTPAEIEHFPHMLVLLDITFGGFICGASAIHTLWAVTAAHCLEFGTPASEINLRGGTSNRLSGGFIFFVESYTLHPQYDPFMLDFDVAIIQVQRDTPLQGNNVVPIPISPTCIHSCCEACEPENVNITGWGYVMKMNIFVNLCFILNFIDGTALHFQSCFNKFHFLFITKQDVMQFGVELAIISSA